MKKFIKHIISKLFFKYCYDESKLADHIIYYYVPNTLRKLGKKGQRLDGQFLFAQVEEMVNKEPNKMFPYKIKCNPFLDIDVKI